MAIDFPRSTYTAEEGVSAESWPASPSDGDTQTNGAGDDFTFNGTSSLWVLNSGRTLTLSGGATYSWDLEKWIAQSHIPFRYFGPQDTDPTGLTADNEGDLYYNKVENEMRVYNGSSWDTITSVGDFNILTLSASSTAAPVGGTASFDGAATRFQLSETPNVAQQLLISINGVVQEPQAGTSPTEGFAVDGNDIIFASAPATGSTFFGVQMGATVNIGTPSDNTVTNAKVATNAAIAGSKIDPDFGSQDIVTTGDVGIGTASVLSDFHIASSLPTIRLEDDDVGSQASYALIKSSSDGGLQFDADPDNVRSSTAITFDTDGTERGRIDASGRILIGTTSQVNATFKLQIVGKNTDSGDAGTRRGILLRYGAADTNSAPIRFEKNRSNTGGTTSVASGDDLGQILFAGTDQDGIYRLAASIDCEVDAAPANDTVPGRLVFYTTPVGNNQSRQQRMIIKNTGVVGIGSSNPESYASDQACLVIEDSTNPALCLSDTGQSKDYFLVANGTSLKFRYADAGGSSAATNVTDLLAMTQDGKVGIGTTAPADKLHVSGTGETNFRLTGSSADVGCYLMLQNSNTGNASATAIQGLDASGQGITEIKSQSTGDANNEGYLTFSTRQASQSMAARMRITSDGDVRIGDLPTQNVGATNGLQIGHTGTPQQRFVRNDNSMNDGDVIGEISCYTNAAQAAQTYNRSGSIKFKAADTLTQTNRATKITFEVGPNNSGDEAPIERLVILPNGNVEISNGDLVMNSGKGIDFSDTANITGTSSEILDDYEEGSWTPVLTASTTNPTYSMTGNWSYYAKIGRLVHFNVDIQVTTTNVGSGDLYVSIPFGVDTTSANKMEQYVGGMGGRSQSFLNLSRQEIGWYYANAAMYMYRQNRDTYGEAGPVTTSYIRTGSNRLTLAGFYYAS